MSRKRETGHYSEGIIVFISAVLILIFVTICFFIGRGSPTEIVSFQLKGSEVVTLYVGEQYNDAGFLATGSATGDLSKYVTVDGKVNTDKEGTYSVKYNLYFNGAELSKVRNVTVIKRPVNWTDSLFPDSGATTDKDTGSNIEDNKHAFSSKDKDSIKIVMEGFSNIYLLNGVSYVEPGCKAYMSNGKDVSDKIVTTGSVDVNTPGIYTLTYTITDSLGRSASVKRTVEVLNMIVYAYASEVTSTSKSVILKIDVVADKFNYIKDPDGKEVKKTSYEYTVTDNGRYTFEVYNTYGLMRRYTYDINNIDKVAPAGSCSGYVKGNKSYITVNASDNIGISKYVVAGKSYKDNTFVVDKAISKPEIIIYDSVGNTSSITCTLENRYTYVSSAPDIKMSYKYVNDGSGIPYGLFSPSSAKDNQEGTPLIVWLHGAGELNSSAEKLKSGGLPEALSNWKLDGINAYVVCPHLVGRYYDNWNTEKSLNNVNNLVDKIIKEKNINRSKIVVIGHSMGGKGAEYMARYGNRYSAMVVFSGYYTGLESSLTSIPTLGYVGTVDSGEAEASYLYMVGIFKKTFGDGNTFVLNASHASVPSYALNLDNNKDNKSDLLEWALAQEKR